MAGIATLQDRFQRTSLNTTLWAQTVAGSATVSFDYNGVRFNFPSTTTGSTLAQEASVASYDATGASASVRVKNVPTGSTSTDCTLQIWAAGSIANRVLWEWEAGTLFAVSTLASVDTTQASVPYNATTHRYWRIRESGGTTFWETAPEPAIGGAFVWTALFSMANPIAMTAVKAVMLVGCFGADLKASPMVFDQFNTTPVMATLGFQGHRPHMFSAGYAR